jgi:DDE family transposase
MTTEPRSVNDGSLLVGVKATPSGWPTASLDPDSGGRRRARSGARRTRNQKSWSSRFQGIAAVTFGAGCRGCPLREMCTTAKDGRSLTLHPHHGLLAEHRKRAEDPAWKADYRRHRPMVERSIAWLVAGGNRKARYRGVTKNNAWLHTRTAALNLRQLLNLGLIRTHGAWALA